MLAAIDWPFAVIAVAVAALAATWPRHRRLIRAVNHAWASEDAAGALDAALRLRRSWLPAAVLTRIMRPGADDLSVSLRYYELAQFAESLTWARRGLRVARVPQIKRGLHAMAAWACAATGDRATFDAHVAAIHLLEQSASLTDRIGCLIAMSGERTLGRIDRALALLRQALSDGRNHSPALAAEVLRTLYTAGRFDEVFRLTSAHEPANTEGQPEETGAVDADEARIGIDRLQPFFRQSLDREKIDPILNAAASAERWDKRARSIQLPRGADSRPPSLKRWATPPRCNRRVSTRHAAPPPPSAVAGPRPPPIPIGNPVCADRPRQRTTRRMKPMSA